MGRETYGLILLAGLALAAAIRLGTATLSARPAFPCPCWRSGNCICNEGPACTCREAKP